MSRWVAGALAGLLLVATSANAAPRPASTSPEGNPPADAPAPSAAPPLRPAPVAPAAARAAPPTTVEGLIITARPATPPVDSVSAFVADISAPTVNGRLARWDRKVCISVIGLKPPYGQKIIDRIALVATTVGLRIGEPGCKPNMVIVATDDSQAMAKMVVDRNRNILEGGDGGTSRGRKALKLFAETPREVRWWHVTQTRGVDGAGYQDGMDDDERATLLVRSMGRVSATTKDDFVGVVIMVDVTRIGVIRFEALSDYLAMVGLAQIDPETDPAGVPTVLNLFSARATGATPPLGLTSWDVAYLQGLYTTDSAVIRGSRQERRIVKGMMGRLGVAADTAGKPDEEE